MRTGVICGIFLFLILFSFLVVSGCTVTDQRIELNLTNLTESLEETAGQDALGGLGNLTGELLQEGLNMSLSVVNSTLGNITSI